MIRHATALRIANEWHGGSGSPLYSFVSTGAITLDCEEEVKDCWFTAYWDSYLKPGGRERALCDLRNLRAYIRKYGPRTPFPSDEWRKMTAAFWRK